MPILVNVKGFGNVEFPDNTPEPIMLSALRSRFSDIAKKNVGTGEVLTSMLTGIAAEPISGLAGIAGTILPGDEGQGARWVQQTQDTLTYKPQTEYGKQYMNNVGEKLQPIGEIIEGASKKLGDKAYSATGSPALAAAAYSAPTALLEGLGLKGARIAASPRGSLDIASVRSGFGAVYNEHPVMYRGVGEGSDGSIIKWVSPNREIAEGYAKARGGSVQQSNERIESPAIMGKASRRDKPSSLISSVIRDAAGNKNFDMDAAKSARKEFLDYFGSEPIDIVDLWKDESSKAVTNKLLKSLGYDAISVSEQGVETYGILK